MLQQAAGGMAGSGEEWKGKKSSESLMANGMCEQISINHEIRSFNGSLDSCGARLGCSTDSLCYKGDKRAVGWGEGGEEEKDKAGKEEVRCKGWLGVGERENNQMIIGPDSHLYKYVFFRLPGERKSCSDTAFSVPFKSKVLSHTRKKRL